MYFIADPENACLDGFSVHAVAAAVGAFFRELPEPLLTRELYTEFLRAMGKCVSCGLGITIYCSGDACFNHS